MVWHSAFLRHIGGGGRGRLWGLVLAALLFAPGAVAEEPGTTQEPAATYFRIGTGSAGGTYFSVGGLIANAVTYRPGGKDCGAGGCGVSGLIAVAQATQGSVENAMQIEAGQLESGLVQADVAYWMYFGQRIYAGRKPAAKLRAIANLYVEDIHLVARRDAGIRSVADLKGKRVSLGDRGSGTDVDARIVLGGFGLREKDVRAQHLGPVPSADLMREGKLDAFFLVSGPPSPAVAELAADTAGGPRAVTLVPIEGKRAARIRSAYPFYSETVVAGGTYRGIAPTVTLGVKAQWLVSAEADEGLVYEITRALWHRAARPLLDAGHPRGRDIRLETALQGIDLPLHPGAARYYREIGLLKN